VQHRQAEGERLAGAGLGEAENVMAVESQRNGLGLNGRGLREPGMRQFPCEGRREAEPFEF
jgi:hypothetical protein